MSFQKSIKVQHKTPISFLCSDFLLLSFFHSRPCLGSRPANQTLRENSVLYLKFLYTLDCVGLWAWLGGILFCYEIWARAQILSSSHMDRGRVGEKELQSWEEEEDSDWVEDQGMYLRGRWRVREQQFMWTLFLTEPKTQGEKCFVVRCLISQ